MEGYKWLIILSIVYSMLMTTSASDTCQFEIVESMPDLLKFNNPIIFTPGVTHESLINMIDNAKKTLRIASFYVTLTAEERFASHPSTEPGRNIMDAISRAAERGVDLQVVLDRSTSRGMSNLKDIETLERIGTVKFLNMTKLLKAGVLHSKFLIADNETFYVGSSNFDWRSYTQIKEIGISFRNCFVLGKDLDKIFQTYMLMSEMNDVPLSLPGYLNTTINLMEPLKIKLNNLDAQLFLGASPPAFNGVGNWNGRTEDIDGLLDIIDRAQHKIDISVMNYSPRVAFGRPKKFWPRIDDALRRAASERKVKVQILFSNWSHVRQEELMWYKSLNAVQSEALHGGGIHVKSFKVPSFDEFQEEIPYARVKHDKYMVTDNGLYIGTSNWSPDYFINTCGVSVVIKPSVEHSENDILNQSIIGNMQELFERDFSSQYSSEL